MYGPFINSLKKILNNNFTFIYIEHDKNIELNKFKNDDVIIIIGIFELGSQIIKKLKSKKIYLIWYWLEPHAMNKKLCSLCDEIYVYSLSLYNSYPKYKNQIIRFVPPLIENTEYYCNYLKKNQEIKLSFLGIIQLRDNYKKYLSYKKFTVKYDLFTDKRFNEYINNNYNIFLNINKDKSKILPTGRICKLLSHKCIIISQYCKSKDMELFKNMLYFCSVDNIFDKFEELIKKTPDELEIISDNFHFEFAKKFDVDNKCLFLKK